MLSQDLIRPIIRHLDPYYDAETLQSCCLVTSIFLREVQPHLFSHLNLWSGFSEPNSNHPIVRFRKLLDKTPHIAGWVTSILMYAPSCTEDETLVFESLTSLRSLSFNKLGEYWSEMPLNTRHVLQSQVLPRLHHLSVDFLFPELLPWNHLPSLHLNTERMGRWIWDEPLSDSNKLKVDHLELNGNAYYQFDPTTPDRRFFLWKFLDLTSIKEIHFDTYNTLAYVEESRACYCALLLSSQMNLTSLTWGTGILTSYNWKGFNGTFDLLQLSFLPMLENLTFEFSAYEENGREPCLQWLIGHFQLSNSHPLKTLSLNFNESPSKTQQGWQLDWEHTAWTNLDTILQQKTLFQLQSLMIGLDPIRLNEETYVEVRNALPMSHGRGVVGLRRIVS